MNKIIFFMLLTVFTFSNFKVAAQPYYFYSVLDSSNYNTIYRVNISNGEKDVFLSNVLNPLVFNWDNYQEWFFLYNRFGITIYQMENPTPVDTILPESNYEYGISALVIPSYDYLFLSSQKELTDYYLYFWEFNTSVYNSQTLSEIKEISTSIHPLAFSSSDENHIYQANADSVGERFITKYSIVLDSIVEVKLFSEIHSNESLLFEYGTQGKILFGYEEEIGNEETIVYFTYDIDSDNYYPEISFPYRSYGYLSPNAEYVILQKALWDTTVSSRENFNGEISLYRTETGDLVKHFYLPPEGKIILCDSYPENVYYLVNHETDPEIYNLTRPLLNSISPSLALPHHPLDHSGTVTGTATGELFTDSSVVYFNEEPKTTSYVSDSVLTFQFSVGDVPSSSGSYPVWVSNYGANSDTLYFTVVDTLPQPIKPILNCVRDNGDKTFTAFFGYDNENNEPVLLPLGIRNYFQHLLLADQGQPVVFLPGEYSYVFSVDFNGDDYTWYLNGNSVTANKRSTPCPFESPQ